MSNCASITFRNGNNAILFIPTTVEVGTKVVVTTERGRELVTVDVAVVKNATETENIQFERLATEQDVEREQENVAKSERALLTAKQLVEKLNLKMKLVEAQYTLDGQKVMISFVCDDRVDFRELVKELATTLKCRIELKQIGARDQAKVVGGIGACGQECCCIRFLNDFDKVSVKMAKTQNLSLNPTKISGVCGRLMCCLSYENDHYAETLKKMPKINSKVHTPDGWGIALYNNILKETVNVRLDGEDIKIQDYPVSALQFDRPAMNEKVIDEESDGVKNE